MANSDNTQTKPAGLPDAPWFTLDEVAARWGTSTEILLRYGFVNHLTLCVYVKNVKIARFEQRPYFLNLFIEGEEPKEAGREWEKVEEWRTLFSPLPIYQYVVAEIQNGQRITLTTFPSDNMNFSFSDADDDSSKEPVYMVRGGVEVGLDDVLIVRREVDRFEREYRIGKYAGTMPDLGSMGKWPWGNYETSLLKHLAEAAKELWALYDPSEPSTAPTNEQVEKLLVGRGLSSSMAAKMATILRADGLPSGPRKG